MAAIDPPSLENWVSVGRDRYQGELHGLPGVADGSLRATIEHDVDLRGELRGALPAPPSSGLGSGRRVGPEASGAAGEASGMFHDLGDAFDGEGSRRYVRTRSGELFQLGAPAVADGQDMVGDEGDENGGLAAAEGLAAALPAAVGGAADAASRAALGARRFVGPAAWASGAMLVAGVGWFVLGHHHVDVSVFIV